MSDQCDSLLFSGLVGCTGVEVNITAAHDPYTDMWHRRPITLPQCCELESWSFWERLWECFQKTSWQTRNLTKKIFERGNSTISRDMLVGLAWYAWINKRLDISESVIKYALSHWMVMGIGTPTRTVMTPGLLSTYAWISHRLGGPNRWWLRYMPQSESAKVTDFQAHLSVLHIMLRRELTGKNPYQKLLEAQSERQPLNPLFAFAAGDWVHAMDLLLEEAWWPDYRLPTNHERHSDWITQRDYGSDWTPDSDYSMQMEFSGGDFLFCAWLILRQK